MADDRPRDASGKFTEKVSEQDILKIFDATGEPFLTTSEVAAELPVSKDAVYRRLERMREKGFVEKKKTGARAVGWWATVAPAPTAAVLEELDEDEEPAIDHEDLLDELELDA